MTNASASLNTIISIASYVFGHTLPGETHTIPLEDQVEVGEICSFGCPYHKIKNIPEQL